MKKRVMHTAFVIMIIGSSLGVARAAGSFCGYQCPITSFRGMVNHFNAVQESSRHTPQVCDANLLEYFLDQDSGAVVGARKLMAMTYGSCNVLTQPIRSEDQRIPASAVTFQPAKNEYVVDKQTVLATHPYLLPRLSDSCSDALMCSTKKPAEMSACDAAACLSINHPALYQAGATLDQQHALFDNVRKKKTDTLATGDSGFLSEAFWAMGVRIQPDKLIDEVQPQIGGLTNQEFYDLGAKDKDGTNLDCFDRVSVEGGFQPGDVIVGAKSHSAMIDTVGKDPFGIEALVLNEDAIFEANLKEAVLEKGKDKARMISDYTFKVFQNTTLDSVLQGNEKIDFYMQTTFLDEIALDACERLLPAPEDYKVTIIHSSPRGGAVGIQREKLFPGIGLPDALSSQSTSVKNKVIAECMRSLRNTWANRVPESNPAIRTFLQDESKFAHGLKKIEQNSKTASRVIRHNIHYDGCRSAKGERPNLEASQCIRCCPTHTTYEALVPSEAGAKE